MSPLTRGATVSSPRGPLGVLDMPGPRWFSPDDAVWRVHAGPAVGVGVTTGLLVLASHPSYAALFAATGADADPWAIEEYLTDLLVIGTFGTVDDAVVALERSRRLRSGLAGVTEHGRFWYGTYPALASWAHCASTWAVLAAHQRFAEEPLDAAGCDEFLRQCGRVAALQGVPDAPTTVRALECAVRSGSAEVRATTTGRRLLRRLVDSAAPCGSGTPAGDVDPADHRHCRTVVDAALALLPAGVARALGHRPGRCATPGTSPRPAHPAPPAPMFSTPAPIAAPSALLVRPDY